MTEIPTNGPVPSVEAVERLIADGDRPTSHTHLRGCFELLASVARVLRAELTRMERIVRVRDEDLSSQVQVNVDQATEIEEFLDRTRDLERELAQARAESVRAFAAAILHGDEKHRAWLLQAAEDFISGKPIVNPAPAPAPAPVVAIEREKIEKRIAELEDSSSLYDRCAGSELRSLLTPEPEGEKG